MIDIRTDHAAYRDLCTTAITAVLTPDISPVVIAKMSAHEKMDWFHSTQVSYRDQTQEPIARFLAEVRGPNWALEDHDDPAFTAENQAYLNTIRDIRQSVYEEFFFNLPFVQGVLADIDQHRQDGIRERDSKVDVGNTQYRVLKKIDVLWSGWECDGIAWLVQTDDGPKIVMSDHGQKHFDNGDELRARIFAYNEAIRETEELLKMAQQ